MKRLIRLGVFFVVMLLIGLFGVFTWMSWRQANTFVFTAYPYVTETPENYQDVEFLSADGLKLSGWWLAPTREDGATILFVHGHGGNRSDFDDWAARFSEEGYGILLFDLRAVGGSEGKYVTMGVNEAGDVAAAFHFLQMQEGVNPERIAIFGHSMGASTAILAAAQIPEARLIIASAPYSSIRNVLNDRIPTTVGVPALFFPDMIIGMSNYLSHADYNQANPLAVVGEIHRPILFMAGLADVTIPYSHSQNLYDAANEPKELHLFEGVDHNDMFELRLQDYLAVVHPFMEHYLINED